MKKIPIHPLFSPAFALISVLALVSLAALTATAFLASSRLDRQATRSLGETARLEMACTSARECASQTLNIISEPKWQTIATYWRGTNATDWTNEIGYLLLGRPNSAANVRWTYFCGFNPAPHKKLDTNTFLIEGTNITPGSYLTEIGSFMGNMTNGFVTNPTFANTNCTLIPLLGGRTSPPVGWTYIYQDKKIANSTNTTNVPVARFSYYMEDLSGLIDAERMGGNNRTTGTNAAEISLTNLITNWSSSSILSATNYTQFINPANRAKYFSPALMLYAGNITTNDLRYFAHGLLAWTNFPNTIPVGIPINNSLGYSQGNQLKINLNSAAGTNVNTIANAINTNLPAFGGRGGGMSASAYVSNIAANIVDYADVDSAPTASDPNNPVYRGVEAIAWPNEIFTRIELVSRVTNGTQYQWTLNLTDYVEVWNISDRVVSLANLTYSNNQNLQFWIGASEGQGIGPRNFSTVDTNGCSPTNAPLTPPAGTSNLAANSYVVLAGPTRTMQFNTTTNTNILRTNDPRIVIPAASSLAFAFRVNGQVVSTGTRWTGPSTNLQITGGSRIAIFPSSVAFGVSENGNSYNLLGGDPRGQLFLGPPLMDMSYNNSTPGGRNRYTGASGGANTVNPPVNWPDGGHSTDNDIPASPTGVTQAPNSFPNLAGSSNHPVQAMNNSGSIQSVLELGNIFDPIQWGGPNPFHLRDTAAWMDLTSVHVASNAACGRNSLRLGRPEHPRFAFTNYGGDTVPNMGMSAAAMLDLFRIGSADSNSFTGGGKINLNTAPRPVLAALAGGVILTNDASMAGSPVNATMTNAFAQGVLRFRQLYPFYSPSQLPFISTDYGQGSWTNTWTNTAVFATNAGAGLAGITALNDKGREEWFSRIYGLSGVDSLNFRVYVIAQLTDANGNPRGAPQRKYYQIYTVPDPQTPAFSATVVEEGSY